MHESDDDLDKQHKPTTDSNSRSFIKTEDSNSLSIASPSSGAETGCDEPKDAVVNCSSLINFGEHKVGDRVNVSYGKGKTQRTYEAKVSGRPLHSLSVLQAIHCGVVCVVVGYSLWCGM